MTEAYPLTWPAGFPRSTRREKSKFKTTLSAALANVQKSLKLFAQDSGKRLDSIVMSSNVTLGAQSPGDPGVAVYFVWDGLQVCIPVDRYLKVEENLQAIHHIIEARRVELRHGGLAIIRATFQGFAALPAPRKADWRSVLGPVQTLADAEASYRIKAKERHPDATGGSHEKMAELNAAIAEARKVLR